VIRCVAEQPASARADRPARPRATVFFSDADCDVVFMIFPWI
jgi:hypothetical protein